MRGDDSLKRPWYGKRWKVRGEGDNRGWDGWTASLTQWTWVWVDSGSWWWTGRPGVLRFMGSQRVGHDWATELNWTDSGWFIYKKNSRKRPNYSNRKQISGCLERGIGDIWGYKKTFYDDENSPESEHGGNIPQHNKPILIQYYKVHSSFKFP